MATGIIVGSMPVKPWKRACWDDDGHPVEPCDRDTVLKYEHSGCFYHDEWMRIASNNAMVAWVAQVKGARGTRFEAYAWDPAAQDHIEIRTKAGCQFKLAHAAMKAVDKALIRFAKAHAGAS